MAPQDFTLLAQVLGLFQLLVDETDLVLLKFSFRHRLELFLEVDEEIADALLEESAILLALNANAEALYSIHNHQCATHDAAKLFLDA